MPEGDTIFRTARALGRALTQSRPGGPVDGSVVRQFVTTMAPLAQAEDERSFVGERVVRVESRGKWVLMVFAPVDAVEHEAAQRVVATHMLMSGSWHIYRQGDAWQKPREQARIMVATDTFVAAAFRVPIARVYTWSQLRRERKIPRVEMDLLREEFDAEAAVKRLMERGEEAIGEVLLNQRVMAGVGNVFKSEVCFAERVNPFAQVNRLSEQQAQGLVKRSRQLLAANVMEDSGDRIVTYRGWQRRTTRSADPSASLWVYGRGGEPCRRCATAIERLLQGEGARVTYWCPACQRRPES